MSILFRKQLPPDVVERSRQFVFNHRGEYGDTRQSDPAWLREQHLCGKLAEFAFEEYLREAGATIKKGVSVEELPFDRRSFDPDIVAMSRRGKTEAVHVKGQPIASVQMLQCITWALQKGSARGRRDPLLDNPYGFMALAVATPEGYVWGLALLAATTLIPSLLRAPLKESQIDCKACIYYRDLVPAADYDAIYREVA